MITEAELIEIEARQRRLERSIDDLTADCEFKRFTATDRELGDDEQSPQSFLQELAEVCRTDMERLSEIARRSLETVG